VKKKQRKKETGSIWGVVWRSLLLPELLKKPKPKKKTGRDRVARQKRVSPTHASRVEKKRRRRRRRREAEITTHDTKTKTNKHTQKNTQKSEEARGYGDDDDCCCCCC
jgi:hypothetical protein